MNAPRSLLPISLEDLQTELEYAHGDWAKFLLRLFEERQLNKKLRGQHIIELLDEDLKNVDED